MNATKLTIIALAAAAIMFSGCSTDNRVLGPGTDFQSESGIGAANRVGLDSASGFGSEDSDPGQKSFTIVAKVERLDVEGGCWYLLAEDGNSYTPVAPKDLVLEAGLKLKAEGYIDEDIQFFCGNGPAFVIENYDVIDRPDKPGDSKGADANEPSKEESAPDKEEMNFITVKGFVNITAAGCVVLKTAEENEFVLRHDADVQLNQDDQISATGYISTLPVITCYEAPVFYAETISVTGRAKDSGDSDGSGNGLVSTVTDDDTDRYVAPSEDRPPEEEQQEEKEVEKKGEEENPEMDQKNDRP